MTHRLLTAVALLLAAAGLTPAAAETPEGWALEENRQDLLYAALCRGVLWPDGRPTLLASEALPAAAALELTVRTGLDATAAAAPGLADILAREAADGGRWLETTEAAGDHATVELVRAECRIHLELFADSFAPNPS